MFVDWHVDPFEEEPWVAETLFAALLHFYPPVYEPGCTG